MFSAFTTGAKATVAGSTTFNLASKSPLTGKPQLPHKLRLFCSAAMQISVAYAYNGGSIGSEFKITASPTVFPTILLECPITEWIEVEGVAKTLTAVGTGDVTILAYYDGTDHDKPL